MASISQDFVYLLMDARVKILRDLLCIRLESESLIILDLAATLFSAETPGLFCELKIFTHPHISIEVRTYWVDYAWEVEHRFKGRNVNYFWQECKLLEGLMCAQRCTKLYTKSFLRYSFWLRTYLGILHSRDGMDKLKYDIFDSISTS